MGEKSNRLGGRYGGEPEKAIADPGNEDIENPVIQTSLAGGSNKSIRRPKEESKMPKMKDMVDEIVALTEKSVGVEPSWARSYRQDLGKHAVRCTTLSKQLTDLVKQSKGVSRLEQGWDIDAAQIEKILKEMTFYTKIAIKQAHSYQLARGDVNMEKN